MDDMTAFEYNMQFNGEPDMDELRHCWAEDKAMSHEDMDTTPEDRTKEPESFDFSRVEQGFYDDEGLVY